MHKNDILEFWFGADAADHEISQRQAALWWQKNPSTDQTIKERFEPTLKALLRGEYRDWLSSADGRLAAILVLDQFSRNMYRDSAMSFTQDALALEWALEGIRQGADRDLRPIYRLFYYLPLEHAESDAMQTLCMSKLQQLHDDAPDNFKDAAADYLDFGRRHQQIIQRFGRFPHRNALLNRTSTKEEREFLQQPGSSF
ncbi:hypothetical protein CHH28_10215 [Bacterioplanes sanyensis]|uniref:DUF924 domain-containing protein n=1 Tax=Bacterioplanes sanyensis TaxID=1249553 RepID=A0A222FJ53_9GAMM|nr:DUF924 family protein [Bacterioplanes sanyensis]ASP39028.1 hypothetical protein CHH28_10215 [Bacterioplanes sanyensis]